MAAVLAMVLLLSSAWMWFNEATVASWLAQQLVVVDEESEEDALLGLQANEHWLVVVVDFEQHPAGNGWGTDDASLLLNQAAVPYVEQLSGMASNLTVHVHPTVVRATGTLAWYGADGANRDTDDGGEFLPSRWPKRWSLRYEMRSIGVFTTSMTMVQLTDFSSFTQQRGKKKAHP